MPVPIIDFIPLGLSKLRPFKFKGSRIWRLSIKGEYFKKGLLGWLEITYLSNKLRICRGDKGTLFVLRKINSPTLFKNFKEFIKVY